MLTRDFTETINSVEFNQQESPLLRLPRELRDIIYGYALGGNNIRYSSTVPKFSPGILPIGNFEVWIPDRWANTFYGPMPMTTLLSLQNTSRQLRAEIGNLIFKISPSTLRARMDGIFSGLCLVGDAPREVHSTGHAAWRPYSLRRLRSPIAFAIPRLAVAVWSCRDRGGLRFVWNRHFVARRMVDPAAYLCWFREMVQDRAQLHQVSQGIKSA